jgi:hypothetical protein
MHSFEQTTSVLKLNTTGALMNKSGEPVLRLPNPLGGWRVETPIKKQEGYTQEIVRKACEMVQKWVEECPKFLAPCEIDSFTGIRGTSFTRYRQECYIVFQQQPDFYTKKGAWGVIQIGTHAPKANYIDIRLFESRESAVKGGLPTHHEDRTVFADFTELCDDLSGFKEQTWKELGESKSVMLRFSSVLIWALRNYVTE